MSPEPPPSFEPNEPGPTDLTALDAALLEERVTQILAARIGPAESPVEEAVAKKLTGGHIDKLFELLNLREKNRHAEATDRHRNRPYLAAGLVVVLLAFVLLLTWLALAYGKSEVVVPVLTGLVGLIGGAVGGYGYGRSQTDTPRHPPTG